MGFPKCSDEEFISTFKAHGATETAKLLGIGIRSVFARRSELEKRSGIEIKGPHHEAQTRHGHYEQKVAFDIQDGIGIVGSDNHYWPDLISTAHRGATYLCKELRPKFFCLNGDGFDGAGISRHPPIGWEKPPSVDQELTAVCERTSEIRDAHPDMKLFWNMGNHDMRFENKLSQQAPQYIAVKGMRLCDHIEGWKFGWSLWINNNVVIKHRFKGGIHATHNNTLWAGLTMVTGHLHSLKVTPFSDYNGTRFGVDTGTMADPHGPQFGYAEVNPLNHRSGFVVLTFHKGKLLWPEIVAVVDEKHIQFRGRLIAV